MNNQSQMYVLKYNLKYALEETDESIISEAEKKQLRQVEYISKNISRAFFVYAPLDVAVTLLWIRWKSAPGGGKGGRDFIQASLGRQAHRSRQPVLALFLTLRLVGMYHFSSEMSQKYLVDNASPILRKSNPMKEGLVEQMKKF